MEHYSDKDLLNLFKNGENKNYAFNLLIKKYQKPLYYHIRRILIDHEDTNDVLQDTFIKIWKNLDNFREDSAVLTWLYRIATNEALNFLKQKRFKLFISLNNINSKLTDILKTDPFFTGNEIERKLQSAILKLPDKQRIVFNMKYFECLKYEEISEILGTSVGALKASYHHAVKKIEKILTSD